MASTYNDVKIELMATGENDTTWGAIANTNLGTALTELIVGSANVTFASGTVTLTLTDSNATQTARNMRLNLIGTSGGARNLVVPAIEKLYIVNNTCADAITIKNTTGTGIAVPAGKSTWVYNNGTNVVDVITHLSSLTLGTASASVGYLNIPQNSQSAAYTTVLDDSGKHIFHPSTDANERTFTIDSNANVAYPVGTAITFVNMTANVVTIAITTDTMYLAGAGTTGSRSLAIYGVATVLKMTSTTWMISGTGLS